MKPILTMSDKTTTRSSAWAPIVLLLITAMLLTANGCKREKKRRAARGPASQIAAAERDRSAQFLEGISSTLNDLAREIDTNLQPAEVILDAMHSIDKQDVMAVCSAHPQVPDGPINYIAVPAGNVNFRNLRVRPGDIVRYYIKVDQDSLEHGYEERTYLQLTVRRLDDQNPENALLIEGGLTVPVVQPERMEIWRYSDKRMNDIRYRLRRYMELRKPPVGWEPSPEETTLLPLIDKTNQWLRGQWSKQGAPLANWQADPLVATLPEAIRTASPLDTILKPDALRDDLFATEGGRLLQQAIWLRDISDWARKGGLSDVEVATALFDWTVRNIQLDPPDEDTIIFHTWQALMYGHGTAEHRAWVFAELCRQQHIDVVMLVGTAAGQSEEATAVSEQSDDSPPPSEALWSLPALLSEGKLYLFDPRLGLPVPGAEPGSVATLAEVIDRPELLRQLDVVDPSSGEQLRYPIDADALTRVEAHLVATPLQLSRRALQLEQALERERAVVLAADTRRQAKQLTENTHVADVRLWEVPYRSLLAERKIGPHARQQAALRFAVFAQRPRLWKARVLHFQGFKPIPPEMSDDPLAEPRRGHREAKRLYIDRRVRPSEKTLQTLPPDKQAIYGIAKGDASYWLGLLCFDMDNFTSATQWLRDRTLDASPEGPWTPGARYNLARTYEAQGLLAEAAELYEADQSPARHGSLLRARALQQQLAEQEAAEEAEPTEEPQEPESSNQQPVP